MEGNHHPSFQRGKKQVSFFMDHYSCSRNCFHLGHGTDPCWAQGVEEGVEPEEGAGCSFGRMTQAPASPGAAAAFLPG